MSEHKIQTENLSPAPAEQQHGQTERSQELGSNPKTQVVLRVGDIYPVKDRDGLHFRVTAFDGDKVRIIHRGEDGHEFSAMDLCRSYFEKAVYPADQSVILGLVGALKALRSFMWSEGYSDQAEVMAQADAAIAKADGEDA